MPPKTTRCAFTTCQRILVHVPASISAGSAQNSTVAPGTMTVMIGRAGHEAGVGPPPTGDGHAGGAGAHGGGGVGPPPTGDGQPAGVASQATGVAPPPTGDGQPTGACAPNVTRAVSGSLAAPSAL